MYSKLSKKSKSIFWTITGLLLALFIYSITLIPSANIYELIIAGLGGIYIIGTIIAWFNLVPELFILRKKRNINAFSIVAIIGIIGAITLNIIFNTTRLPQALPITIIPAAIVLIYFIFILRDTNKSKK
ncbi:MAG: hypothetical protein PF542_00775 [Nanoarchaeota archaeon]|jgi:drug/metabolite transporter superfamily protein YnfA|nr:hypothetical protein [Nanoarchaeota archaeon]